MTKLKIGLISAAVFLFFLLLGWVVGLILGPDRSDIWMLRGTVWALGAAVAVLVHFYLLSRYRSSIEGKSGAAGADDIDVAIAAAEARLRSAAIQGPKRLRNLPVAIVCGPGAAAKTSIVTHSGAEPELLAGEVERGGSVVPTSGVNVWFTREMILAEAGGAVLDDETRWSRFIKRLRPSRLAAAFGRGRQAPRVAIVCFPCDEFLKPGNSESVPAAAGRIRERLAEASRQLGIRLPVYVVFTKSDRLPYFEDFVRNLSREEAQQVLGATLPAVPSADVGLYAERESVRIRGAIDGIYRALALKRLDLLPREARIDVRSGAYEFPREFRKISDLATGFLLELCRPRHLGGGPFLRGFYFTGVRPVVISDVASDRQPPSGPRPQVALGATVVFNPMAAASAQPASPSPSGGRKVPEWTFLRRVFHDVVFQDRNAMALTAGGAKVNFLRRLALGAATGLAIVFIVGFTVSFLGNRRLVTDAFAAARATEGIVPSGGDPPSADALARLDELRDQAALLRQHRLDGRPARLGWGLYTGTALLPELRAIYFDRFARLLWGATRDQLLANLRGLPDSPEASAEYGTVYDLLKAHLITTSHPTESTAEFLAPVLLGQWAATALPDDERRELARRQFAFFGGELPHGNPYSDAPEEATVARTRMLLQQFSNVDQFYQAMISEASREYPALRFDEVFPGAGAVVTNSFEVPGAFTAGGWDAVQANLQNIDRLFAREDWVVGERAVSAEDRVRLAQDLRARYVADYIAHWRDYLRAGSVARGSGVAATGQALARLSGNESPLLQMLALAARNTAVDSAAVLAAFQPVHSVTPPGVTDRFISDANAPYIAALANLQSAMEQVGAASGPARDQALGMAVAGADRVRSEVRALAQRFSIEGEASIVGTTVQNLLQAPVAGTESLLGALPSAEINQAGAAFCEPFRQLTTRFPFNPASNADATIDQVNAVFQRGSSALWAFHDDVLQGLLARQGTRFAVRVGASPQPTPQFVAFFNRAAEFSEALYDANGGGPAISFLLRAQTSDDLPEITINIDGQAQTFTRTFAAARPYTWQGSRAQVVRISGAINGRDETLLEGSGPWGLFRLFQAADWESLGGDRYMLRWPITGRTGTVAAELTMNSGTPPVFRRGYFDQFTCVSQIVR